jgi:sterol desaturase/sphingolipid hydroxylase (fatty acid hydroxylase superfamily)
MIALAVLAGVLTWSFLEYVIHRWLGHDKRFRGNPFGVEHIRHHAEGNYFAPSWKKLIAAALVTAALGAPALLVGGRVGAAYIAGLIGFYGAYEVLHRLEHVWAGFGPYGRWARRHHFTHHFVDARCNHGVTSPLWDLVFGTYRKPEPMIVPRKLRMPWLEDPKTGEVRADWADLMSFGPARR